MVSTHAHSATTSGADYAADYSADYATMPAVENELIADYSARDFAALNRSIQDLNNTIHGLDVQLLNAVQVLDRTISRMGMAVQEVNQRLLDAEGHVDMEDLDFWKVTGRLEKVKEKLIEDFSKKVERADSTMSTQRGVLAQVLVILSALSTATMSTNRVERNVVLCVFIPVILAVVACFFLAVISCRSKLKGVSQDMDLLVAKKKELLTMLSSFDGVVSRSYTSLDAEFPISIQDSEKKLVTINEVQGKLDKMKTELEMIKNEVIYNHFEVGATTTLSVIYAVVLIVVMITSKHKDSSRNGVPSPSPSYPSI